MVRTSKGTMFRSRKVMRKSTRKKGLPPPSSVLKTYNPGDKVDILIESAIQKGQPHRRFHGRTATVLETRGKAVVLEVRDGNAMKTIIARCEHVRPHNLPK
ncbi:MAG: 50S ribosomal protein L21e [Candidatus Hodarchaeota archaeon]